MPIVTEAELREQLGVPRRGAVLAVPAGARLTPAADDLVRAWELELAEAGGVDAAAGPTSGREPPLPGTGREPPAAGTPSRATGQAWDRPGRFPVVLEGEVPTCHSCGSAVRDKPSHLTQLDAHRFAPKTDPRIRLRGRLDSLHALTLAVAARARGEGYTDTAGHLDTLAAYCRELLAAEYHARAPGALALAGLDEATIHHASHHPQEAVGLPHLVPDATHPETLHWLNVLRCQVREAEVLVLDAYPPERDHTEVARGLARAVNRLSSGVYVLELRLAAAIDGGDR